MPGSNPKYSIDVRWFLSTTSLVACLLATSWVPATAQSSGGGSADVRRVVIQPRLAGSAALRAPGSPLLSPSEASQISARLEAAHQVRTTGRALHVGVLFAEASPTQLAALAADPLVASVELDVLTYLGEAGDVPAVRPAMSMMRAVVADAIPWGVTRVGAEAAWASGATGSGVKVGIIDSGIDPNHPDLNVVGGYDFTTGSNAASAYADNISSCNGHGTHVAGTVGALQNGSGVVGVAPGVQLYALKVFEIINGGCAAWSSNQIAAIDWAVANGLRVVNLSIASSSALTAYQNAINNATAAGVLVVAAAGNNSGGPITYPAAYDNAVAVSALTSSDQLAYFSNVGPQMWVAAPGSGITSTMPGGGTGSKSGTSMAAPHVAGVAALMIQLNPGWSATQVRNALRDGALDLAAPGWDSGTGWGMAKAPTSGGGSTPLTLAVSPTSRNVSVQQGGSAPADQASVTLSGTNASSTAWSATKRKSWTTLTTGSGTGSGTVAWSRNAGGLAAGTYVDTITVTVSGATGSPARVIDTLVVTAAPPPLTLAVSPTSRNVSVQQGGSAPADQASVTLSGTNAASTAWSASKRKSWTTLTTGSGTGSGTVAWSRNAGGLAAGTYVDTITVTVAGATGSPARVIDTLIVTPGTQPVTMAVSPSSRSATVQQGGAAPTDSATISMSGTNAWQVAWSATKRKPWTTLTTAGGSGNGMVRWSRSAAGLAPGTYVDTITVSAAATGSPARVIDTLIVTAAPAPLTLAVSPASRRVNVTQGGSAPGDQASVTLSGTGASTTAWTATRSRNWITLTTPSGTGSGTLSWSRNTAGLVAGTYVDTISVTVAGAQNSPAMVIDSLVITTPASGDLVLAVSPSSRSATTSQGGIAPPDQASVSLSGTNAATTAWTATKRQGSTTLTTAGGIGSGTVAWNRNASGLAAGIYVDTITVTAAGATGSPATVIDTLIVTAVDPLVVAVVPGSRLVQVAQGNGNLSDAADIVISGAGAVGAAWTATARQPWTNVQTSSGTGSAELRWQRRLNGLQPGTYVDTITVVSGAASARMIDSLVITTPTGGEVVLSRGGSKKKQLRMDGQQTSIEGDSVVVVGLSGGAASGTWVARGGSSWITLKNTAGTFPGLLRWDRNTVGLGVGTHVDSIIIELADNPEFRAVYVDSVQVVNVVTPSPTQAADALFRGPASLNADQRAILDAGGNRNGQYDLGDFLAWVERSNIRLSAGVMAEVRAAMEREAATKDDGDLARSRSPRPEP